MKKKITGIVIACVLAFTLCIAAGCEKDGDQSGGNGNTAKTQEELFAEWVKGRDDAMTVKDGYTYTSEYYSETNGVSDYKTLTTEERSGKKFYYVYENYANATATTPDWSERRYTKITGEGENEKLTYCEFGRGGTFNEQAIQESEIDGKTKNSPLAKMTFYSVNKGKTYDEFCKALADLADERNIKIEYSFKAGKNGEVDFVMTVENSADGLEDFLNKKYDMRLKNTFTMTTSGGKMVKIVEDDNIKRIYETESDNETIVSHEECKFTYGTFDDNRYDSIVEKEKA